MYKIRTNWMEIFEN